MKSVVSKETLVLRRWESETRKFELIRVRFPPNEDYKANVLSVSPFVRTKREALANAAETNFKDYTTRRSICDLP